MTFVAIVACSKIDEESNDNDQPTPEKPKAEIQLDTSTSHFMSEGGTDEISFTSTEAWTAEIINSRADMWCSINPTSGAAGNATITVTTEPDNRSASIVIKAGSASKTATVSQKQKDALTVTASTFEVESKGGEVKIEVKANINFDYAIEESAKEWVKYVDTRALETSSLTFSIAENDDTTKREAKIYITSDELNEEITIYQEGSEPSIVISINKYVVSAEGETIAVEVKHNVDVAVELPPDVDWVKENITRGISTNIYYFDIAHSEIYDARSAEIKFTNKIHGLSEVVRIVQAQKDAIILAESVYEFDFNGGNLDFEILTNVDFDVIISDAHPGLVQQVHTRALETRALHFIVYRDWSNYEGREWTITISGGNASQIITVKQSGLKAANEKEREALIEFYKATGGDNWINNENWCSDKPIQEWYGITTYEGLVTEIDLKFNNLDGELPEQIGEFHILNRLYLTGNKLKGELPESLAKHSDLGMLFLSGNQFSGNVSHIIDQLPHLNMLALDNNYFTGGLPEVGKNMTRCDLSNNLFTGSIPESHIRAFENNPNTFYSTTDYGWDLHIDGNNLNGKVPDIMLNHKSWVAHWRDILPQNPGYGFEKVDIPAPNNVVKCYDDSFLDLAEEYKRNQYTVIFRWAPICYWSSLYVEPIYQLYNKYKDKGLGLLCTTHSKHTMDEISPLTSVCKDVKVFFEGYDDSWDNNPLHLTRYFFLFRSGFTPYFHVVDSNGNILFYGSGDKCGESVPQYHENRDEIYEFVANLFGDDKYEFELDYSVTGYSIAEEVKE